MHDGVLVVADPEVVNDHSANLPGRMTAMSIRHDDTDGDYLYIIGRLCLSVTKNDHFAQLSQFKVFSGSNFFSLFCSL